MADPFMNAGASKGGGNRPPTVAQLGSGAPAVTRTYAPGSEQEITGVKTTGRLVAVKPLTVDRNLPAPTPGKTQDRMTCDVTVFDGEDIAEVLDKDGEPVFTPPEPWEAPFFLPKMYISQVRLVGQLEDHLKNGTVLIGRIGKLPKNSNGYREWAFLEAMPDEIAAAVPVFEKLKPNPFSESA
jgi:hypothetical protein